MKREYNIITNIISDLTGIDPQPLRDGELTLNKLYEVHGAYFIYRFDLQEQYDDITNDECITIGMKVRGLHMKEITGDASVTYLLLQTAHEEIINYLNTNRAERAQKLNIMAKKNEVENVESMNEVVNTVTNSDVQAGTDTDNGNDSPEYIKAQQILRASLPILKELNWSFEKRTGAFFKRVLVEAFEKDGVTPKYTDDGKTRLLVPSRKVIALFDEVEEPELNADGTPKIGKDLQPIMKVKEVPTDDALKAADEIAIKRASAYVVDYDNVVDKLDKRESDLKKQLEALALEREHAKCKYNEARNDVENYVLPVTVKSSANSATKAVLEAKVTALDDANKRMRQMLIAAGMNPDTGAPIQAGDVIDGVTY